MGELICAGHDGMERAMWARGDWDTADFWAMVKRLQLGDPTAVEPALRFLEDDPWTFGSGWAKEHVARKLARHCFTREQQERLAHVALRVVDAGDRLEFRWYCRLARHIDARLLRDELVARLRDADQGVERRAVWMLARLRRPRLREDQLVDARSVVEMLASTPGAHSWSHSLRNLAVRFWSLSWEAELFQRAASEPESRSGALRLLTTLPRLHLPDADERVAGVVEAVLSEPDFPDTDWSAWFDQVLVLGERAQLVAVVDRLSKTTEPTRRVRLQVARYILTEGRERGGGRAGP